MSLSYPNSKITDSDIGWFYLIQNDWRPIETMVRDKLVNCTRKTQKTLEVVRSLLKSNNNNACTYLNILTLSHALANDISFLNLKLPLSTNINHETFTWQTHTPFDHRIIEYYLCEWFFEEMSEVNVWMNERNLRWCVRRKTQVIVTETFERLKLLSTGS